MLGFRQAGADVALLTASSGLIRTPHGNGYSIATFWIVYQRYLASSKGNRVSGLRIYSPVDGPSGSPDSFHLQKFIVLRKYLK